jgi:hypothetical protein
MGRGRVMETTRKNIWPYVTTLFFLSLIGASIYWWVYQNRVYPDLLIAQTIDELSCIFAQIDTTAGIAGFVDPVTQIDFLTFKNAHQLKSLKLMHLQKWNGPYRDTNPEFQEKLYQIIKANDGYWVLPGNGVELSNGKIIGKDIVIGPTTRVQSLLQEGVLKVKNKLLTRRITIGGKSSQCAKKKLQIFSPELLSAVPEY